MPTFEVPSIYDDVITSKCCIHCQEKQEKQRKIQEKQRKIQEKQDSTCKHTEDVCQHCLEKVETTTEEDFFDKLEPYVPHVIPKKTAREKKKDSSPLSPLNKKLQILISSSTIVASGVLWYFYTKKLFNTADKAVNSIFETLVAPTRKE